MQLSSGTQRALESHGVAFPQANAEQAGDEDLRRYLQQIHDVAHDIHGAAKRARRDLTAQESVDLDLVLNEFDRIANVLSARGLTIQGGSSIELLLQRPMRRPTSAAQPVGAPGILNISPGGSQPRLSGVRGVLGRDVPWARLHDLSGPEQGGFASLGEFMRGILSGDQRLLNATMTEGVGVDGGFAIPSGWLADIMDSALEQEVVRPRAMVFPMQGPTLDIPVSDSFDHSSNIGGFAGRWVGEASTSTAQNAKLIPMRMTASKLAIFADASNELVEDARNFERFLVSKLIQAVAWYLDSAFLTGNGVAKPLGVLNSPSLLTVSKESGQTAATIVANNLLKMFSRLHPACHRNAVWVANPTCLPMIASVFTLPINKGGSDYVPVAGGPLFNEPEPGVFSLMGKPLLLTEKLPALGTVGDIILVDFSKYNVAFRRFATVEQSKEAKWYDDLLGWRCTLRVDGKAAWPSVVTPKYGSSLSWAVALEAR